MRNVIFVRRYLTDRGIDKRGYLGMSRHPIPELQTFKTDAMGMSLANSGPSIPNSRSVPAMKFHYGASEDRVAQSTYLNNILCLSGHEERLFICFVEKYLYQPPVFVNDQFPLPL